MTPDSKVEPAGDALIRDGGLLARVEKAFESVLVEHQDVEIVLVDLASFRIHRPLPRYPIVFKCHVKSLVLDVADPVERYLYRLVAHPFRKQNRRYLDPLNVHNFAKVVHIRINVKLIQAAEHLESNWVVVVSMYCEHRQPDLVLIREIVCLREVVGLKSLSGHLLTLAHGCLAVAKDMLVENLRTLVIRVL